MPVGGSDEIGLNMYIYGLNGKMIIVDCGYGFLGEDYPGMDMGIMDATFLDDYQDKIEGLFITHAHEDHFGAIAHVWPHLKCPVYATNFAAGLIEARLKEHKLDTIVPINIIKDERVVKLPNFEVEFVAMVHTVPETCALVIRTPKGNVVHATDWRFDDDKINLLSTDFAALEKIAQEGVDVLVSDSTNILFDGEHKSEMELREDLLNYIPQFQKGLVATCFSTNIVRLESLIMAALKARRIPVLVGRSIINNIAVADRLGYLGDLGKHMISLEESKQFPKSRLLYLCTGGQGDYRSAVARLARKEIKEIDFGKGDAVIFSSKIIPGNEMAIKRIQDRLIDQDIEVITNDTHFVHTSGHPNKGEVKRLYELLHPKISLPVHGDKLFIKEHIKFAKGLGVPVVEDCKNGEILLIKDGQVKHIDQIEVRILGVDRKQLTPLDSEIVKKRKRIMFNCSVFISILLDAKDHLLDLQIQSADIMEEAAFKILADEIIGDIKKALPHKTEELKNNQQRIVDYIRGKTRKDIEKATGIKPLAMVSLMVV